MSQTAYLTIKGKKQGAISGGVIIKGREHTIAVYAYNHEILSPRDPTTGLATGKRQHRPLHITKEIEESSPSLLSALVNNENLTEFTLRFYATANTGLEKLVYTLKLTNATISSITQNMELNKTEPGIKLPILEEVSFTYQSIQITWEQTANTATDDWQTPVT